MNKVDTLIFSFLKTEKHSNVKKNTSDHESLDTALTYSERKRLVTRRNMA